MKCLHICNDLLGSKVHLKLYTKLTQLGLDQVIYYPIRKSTISKHKVYLRKPTWTQLLHPNL